MAGTEQALTDYVRGILARDGVTSDTVAQSHVPRGGNRGGLESAGPLRAQHVETLKKVEQGEPLNAQERANLEAIVIPNGLRPSFDVAHDSFEALPEAWSGVNDHRSSIEAMIRGIGRLNLSGHPSLTFVGTAFVVTPDLLLTNRHVAEFFVDRGAAAPQFKPGISAKLDFKQEVGSTESLPVRITAPVTVLDMWDAALLRVEPLPPSVAPLPLARVEPAVLDARLAVVVGYPAMDPASDLIQQIQIFRGVFDKKRLTPGRLMGLRSTESFARTVQALGHDCTTLGGNSGSAVIDVESGKVIGLHFAGEHLVANFAVPTWELAAQAAVTSAGVPFV
jgi:V8-like Glu-specific endopeptidase